MSSPNIAWKYLIGQIVGHNLNFDQTSCQLVLRVQMWGVEENSAMRTENFAVSGGDILDKSNEPFVNYVNDYFDQPVESSNVANSWIRKYKVLKNFIEHDVRSRLRFPYGDEVFPTPCMSTCNIHATKPFPCLLTKVTSCVEQICSVWYSPKLVVKALKVNWSAPQSESVIFPSTFLRAY